MDHSDDKALDRLLESYVVAPADEALLEHIMAQAVAMPIAVYHWRRAMPLLAACAVLGFWIGGATLPAVTTAVAQQSSGQGTVNFDNVILGPTTFQEVIL